LKVFRIDISKQLCLLHHTFGNDKIRFDQHVWPTHLDKLALEFCCTPKTTMLKCKTRINIYKLASGTFTPCYSCFWVEYHNGSLKHHKHWFCPDDLNYCVGGTTWKFVVVRLVVPIVWPIQKGTNLTQKEVTTLEEARFSFDRLCRNKVQSW
jgi:hypothetical protein